MAREDGPDVPPTTRIGPAGGSGRGLWTIVFLVLAAVGVAVVKPWAWLAEPGLSPAVAISPSAAPAPTASPADWTRISDRVVCLADGAWMAVVDEVEGPTTSRSWTLLDLVPASQPTDPDIARVHVYADAVTRIGFCAPAPGGSPDASAAAAGGGATGADGAPPSPAPFLVQAWRLLPGVDATGSAEPVALVPVAGGTGADRGALYGPPPIAPGPRMPGGAPTPTLVAAGGSPAPGTRTPAAPPSWPPGRYVFRVQPADGSAAWLAIEVRGPWPGVAGPASPAAPAASPGPTP